MDQDKMLLCHPHAKQILTLYQQAEDRQSACGSRDNVKKFTRAKGHRSHVCQARSPQIRKAFACKER